jgi:hypothetical protein
MSLTVKNKISRLQVIGENILVADMNFKERFTSGGIVLLNDDGKTSGIRPRWGRVYAIGPNQTDVQVGQWICVAHGRWTRGVEIEDSTGTVTIRKVDPKDILLVSDEQPGDDTLSDAIQAEQKSL